MNITFWKNNKIDQEYLISVDTIINDFIKSKYQSEDYSCWPFERRFITFLLENNYGSYDPFVEEQWKNIVDSFNFHKKLELYKDFI